MGILQERLAKYTLPQQYQAKGVYPYFRAIEGKQGTEVEMGGHHVLMFGSNAYTGLTGDERIIQAGIKRVVYRDEYRLQDGPDLLRKAGIEVEQVDVD